MNDKTIYQVDAFTDVLFKGNPAGVMLLSEPVTDDWMQNIAMEMNLSETAFLFSTESGYDIRYFTPTEEIPLCGHATLASAHILYELGIESKTSTIQFKSKGGDLSIKKEGDWIVMDFPKYKLEKIAVHKDFKDSVGFEPVETYASNYNWIVAVADEESTVQNAKPNFDLMLKKGLGHLMITAKANISKADFVCRCFAPVSGIEEDPVTGSAHCALTPLWAERLGKNVLVSKQLSKRTGELQLELINDRVKIKGKAVTFFKAILS